MSVGFGFSAGDFISALNLVGTVISALQDAGGAGSKYRELVRELYTLESALLRVKNVELEDSQGAERAALRQAASQCQRTIDDFWKKTQKYQTHLSQSGHSSLGVNEAWMKVRWAVCKKDDLVRFRADLEGHARSIEMLLAAVQMEQNRLRSQKEDQQHVSLNKMIQAASLQVMGQLSVIRNTVGSGIEQGKQLIQITVHIMRLNVHVFQMVDDIHTFITSIPGQVSQRDVQILDALGRHATFSLDFIRSKKVGIHPKLEIYSTNTAKAFLTVLEANMANAKEGPGKIARGEFIIQESRTKRRIDLSRDWDSCFQPGQRVEMSIAFQRPTIGNDACPGCKVTPSLLQPGPEHLDEEQDIECNVCGLTYRRTTNRRMKLPRLWGLDDTPGFFERAVQNNGYARALPASGLPDLARVAKPDRNPINPDGIVLSFRRVVIVGRSTTKYSQLLEPIELKKEILQLSMEKVQIMISEIEPSEPTVPTLICLGLRKKFRTLTASDEFVAQVSKRFGLPPDDEAAREELREQIEEVGYEVYQDLKPAVHIAIIEKNNLDWRIGRLLLDLV
ncbi:hypothetical protein MMC30_007193 [Trapelia coarctata]|nr:hypothetical protein [Trapelia coarctata]